MAGLVPAISIHMAQYLTNRDRRDKPGDDGGDVIYWLYASTRNQTHHHPCVGSALRGLAHATASMQ
jgi:hypothetical protein